MLRTLENIISDSTEALRPLLQEAFEAGRVMGREEATISLKAKIADALSIPQEPPAVISEPVAVPTVALADDGKRATTGSVKPTIAKLIAEAGRNGLTAQEIVKATNFKPNSVRGTLWTLGNEETIVKRQGRWFPVSSSQEETEAVGASVRH